MKAKRFIAILLTLITVFNLLPLSTVASAELLDPFYPPFEEEDEFYPSEDTFPEEDRFNITIITEGNGGYAYGGGSFTYGDFVWLAAEVYDSGTFEGWYINNELVSTSTDYMFYVEDNLDIVAKFSNIELRYVTFVSGLGGFMLDDSGYYAVGSRIELDPVADEGFEFSHWTAEGNVVFEDIYDPYTAFIVPDEDVVIKANWSTDCMHEELSTPKVVTEGTCVSREIIESTCVFCGETVRDYGYYGEHNFTTIEVDIDYNLVRTCDYCNTTWTSSIPEEVHLESVVDHGGYFSYNELNTKAYADSSTYIYASSDEIDFIISDPEMLEIEEAFDHHYNFYKFTFKKAGTVKVSVVSEYDDTIHYNNYTFTISEKPKAGDINGDGTLNSADARLILRLAAKISACSETTLQYADTDGNGTVSAADARVALRVSARIEDASVLAEFVPKQNNNSWYYDCMTSHTLTEGDNQNLDYFIVRQDSAVTWQSSNPAAVKVDKNGKITAVKKGFSCIIVSNGTETYYYEINVKNALQNKIETFKNKYPEGYYWNNHTPSKKYPNVTETPCSDHESGRYAYCKGQCAGFADLLFREVHGNVKKSYGVTWDTVKIGDYIRLKPHHSVFVTDVIKKGDIIGYDYYDQQNIVADATYMIVAHCNWGMTCNILWDDTFTQRYSFDTSLCYTVK